MSITKRGRTDGRVMVSTTMLECPKCGRRDLAGDKIDAFCPKCNEKMVVAFCSACQANDQDKE